MKKIPLTQGMCALVSDEDYDRMPPTFAPLTEEKKDAWSKVVIAHVNTPLTFNGRDFGVVAIDSRDLFDPYKEEVMTLPTKVTKDALTNKIADVAYVAMPDGRTTICQLTMLNGFTVRGESSCVSVENFNKALGEEYSYEKAFDDAWAFEGYLLAEDRHREARGDINTLESLQQDARLKMAHELMEILGFDDPTQIVAHVRMLNECLIAHESRPKPANMIMLRLGDGCWVASDTIGEVKVNALANMLTVRTKNGIGHSVDPDYGSSIYTTAARLIDEINAANESSTRKDGDPVLQVVADSDAV